MVENKKNRTLILVSNNSKNMLPENIGNTDIKCLYKTLDKKSRILRKIIFILKLPFYNFLFGDWFKKIKFYDEIIIFDTGNLNYIYKIIKKKFPVKKIIIWYWNNTNQTCDPQKLIKYKADIWSFDFFDIKKYGFKYNSQFYFKEKMIEPYNKYTQDVFYVGADKDRAKILSNLIFEFKKSNITYNINLVKCGSQSNEYGIKYKKALEYPDVIKNVIESKAIIDLVSFNQGGLTLRPLEALFYKKKLITNMKEIVNYNFYNKNNIFIIEIDDFSKLKEFINSPYDDKNWNQLIEFYEFNNWLERFNINN